VNKNIKENWLGFGQSEAILFGTISFFFGLIADLCENSKKRVKGYSIVVVLKVH